MFGRRKKGAAASEITEESAEEVQTVEVEDVPAPPSRPQGPWDDADVPDDEVNRIDLGGLLVPFVGIKAIDLLLSATHLV